MTTKKVRRKFATVVAASVNVLCPFCGAEQPSPGNGSDIWLNSELDDESGEDDAPAKSRECVSCDMVFLMHAPRKVMRS